MKLLSAMVPTRLQATLARLIPGRRTEEAIDLYNGQISREEVSDVELRAVRIQRNAMRMRSDPIGYCAHLGRRHEVIVARVGDGRVHEERILLERDDLDLRRQDEGVLWNLEMTLGGSMTIQDLGGLESCPKT